MSLPRYSVNLLLFLLMLLGPIAGAAEVDGARLAWTETGHGEHCHLVAACEITGTGSTAAVLPTAAPATWHPGFLLAVPVIAEAKLSDAFRSNPSLPPQRV